MTFFLVVVLCNTDKMIVGIFQSTLLSAGFTTLLLLVSSVQVGAGGSDVELLAYEPLQYIRTSLPSADGVDSAWSDFVELSAREVGDLTAEMKKKLKVHLAKSGTSVVFAKGERVLTQRRSSNLKWDSKIEVPFSNFLSLFSVTLPILLEGYKHSVISDPIGQVLKGNDLKNPLVTGHESNSFLDLLNKLPTSPQTAALDLDSDALMKELKANGALAVHFANAVLGKTAKEAWTDALMAIGMEEMMFTENGHLIMTLNNLLQFTHTLLYDFNLLGVVPKSEMFPADGDRFIFGWWQNCPKTDTSDCFFPNLPKDTLFSLSPNLRIYVSPSTELLMIVLGPDASPATANGDFTAKKKLDTIGDIIKADAMIWEQLYSVVSTGESTDATIRGSSDAGGASQSDRSEEEPEKEKKKFEQKRDTSEQSSPSNAEESVEDPEQSQLAKWIHWSWPMLVFLFWVTISHVWVYWMFHCCWFIITRISSRAHIPRPKTAADAGQN